MRKIRKWSFLGILGVVVAVLFLVSISFMQAQVKITKGKPDNPGKPPKPDDPPEATWAVGLPVSGTPDTMLYGDGATYINNDTDVRIKVEKGSSRVRVNGKRQIVFYYYFSFKLLRPTGRYAGFQDVELDTVGVPEDPYGVFPDGACMQDFLNQNQPHSEYEYFNLKFQVGQHSFTQGLGYIIDGIEDENWGYNVPVKFVGYSDWIKIRVENQVDFSDPYTEYHNVECDERNYDDDDLTNMNIWIVRLEESKWRICVGYNPIAGNNPGANLLLQEQYTERSGKGKNKTVTVVPYEATGNFSFYIDFIKIPPSTN